MARLPAHVRRPARPKVLSTGSAAPLAAVLALCLAALPASGWSGEARAGEAPPEPSFYRMDDYRAPTPATLAGATVLSPAEAEALWKETRAVFVDVLPRPPRPANLPEGTVWHEKPHKSIPGAVWLPNVGYGAIDEATERYFRVGLEAVTGGDLHRPVVLFCERGCWMSWNAAKRALTYGYDAVSWFPDGTEGWSEEGLPLQPVEPRAAPGEPAREDAVRH